MQCRLVWDTIVKETNQNSKDTDCPRPPVMQPAAFFCCLPEYVKPPSPWKVSLFVSVLDSHAQTQSQTWPLTPGTDTDALCGAVSIIIPFCMFINDAICIHCSPWALSHKYMGPQALLFLVWIKHLAPSSLHTLSPLRMLWHSQRRFHSPVNNPGIDTGAD